MPDPQLAIPPGDRLVHIGFDKTGTTGLQRALHADRERLREHGVVYPGTHWYQKTAGIAITEAQGNTGDAPVTMAAWADLLAEVKAAGAARVLVSSEWLCRATDRQARRVVRDLGGKRVHIVATLRPLTKILPSAWQQYVKDGYAGEYEEWLRGTLSDPTPGFPTPWFWARHRHEVVLERWAGIVGPAKVTAIVVDSRDHDLLLRQFEALLGLPEHFLHASAAGKRNDSLTWPEAELLRQVNQHFAQRGLPDELYSATVRRGIVPALASARGGLAAPTPISTPRWALERAAEIGGSAAAAIERSGIRVLGDLAALGAPPGVEAAGEPSPQPPVEVATAVQAITGALKGSQAPRPPQPAGSRWRRARRISPVPEF
ncbi:MAG TPA: hypothetical protein VHE57_13765 [Mycobacteriales bacterium]|nr:hypothetical protein [Mycobacteriales bacterium]